MLDLAEPQEVGSIAPVSFAQSAMLFTHELVPDPSSLNLLWAVRFSGALDLASLQRAVTHLIYRHGELRATFRPVLKGLEKRVRSDCEIRFPVVDFDQCSSLEELAKEFGGTPFDLAGGPLFRFKLVRMSAGDHVLLCGFHHLVIDGHSWQIFVRELWQHLSGEPEPALDVAYHDFSEWQSRQLATGNLANSRDYWSGVYRTASPWWELPTDHSRPKSTGGDNGVHLATLSDVDTGTLRSFVARTGTSPFRTAFAAFVAFLHRVTGQDDLLLATTLIGRSEPCFSKLVGCFVNTGGIRVRLEEGTTFEHLVAEARAQFDAAVDHQQYPFDQAVRDAAPQRELGRDPFSPVAFVKLPTSSAWQSPVLEMSEERIFLNEAGRDLSVYMHNDRGTFRFTWVYRKSLFDPSTIQRFAGQFQSFLVRAIEQSGSPVSRLELVSPAERHQILRDWNDSERIFSGAGSVPAMVEAQVARTPDRIAVVGENLQLTYRQLNGVANRVASQLRSRGIGAGHFVPILMETSPEFLIAELAVMKSGAAFVPVDPCWPRQRISLALDRLGAGVVLVRRHDTAALAGSDREVLIVASDMDGEGDPNLGLDVNSNDPIYCIFTSGSSGAPKAAINLHGGISNRLAVMTDRFGTAAEDAVLATTPAFADSSVWQYFWPLTCGGRSVVLPTRQVLTPQIVAGLVELHHISFTDFVPAIFHLLTEHLSSHPEMLPAFSRMRHVLIGGESMQADAVNKFKAMLPHVAITNAYGPTETSIGVIFHPVDDKCVAPIPIGRPISNTRAVVVDRHLNLAPVGVAGELCVGGICVGKGYLDDPASTARAFIPNPFVELGCSTLYRTGDLARFRSDGVIEFLGRLDRQVKIRGVRIELGEIETALMRHPSISQAVVIVSGGGTRDNRLSAFIVRKQPEAKLNTADLRDFLASILPASLVPSTFTFLDTVPLTNFGKIDQAQLLALESSARTKEAHEAPIGDLESALVQIWAELLKCDRIGRHDNFFDVGGDSLLVLKLVSEIEDRLGRELPIAAVFQSPTVEMLARRLTSQQGPQHNSLLIPLQPLGARSPVFCVHGLTVGVAGFLDLARRFALDRPVYGFQAVGSDGFENGYASIEDLAANYVREIRGLRPHGPYHLIGYSHGGWIAYEVAQQLRSQGAQVGLVALLDTRSTYAVTPWYHRAKREVAWLISRVRFHAEQLKSGELTSPLQYTKGRLLTLASLLRHPTIRQSHARAGTPSKREPTGTAWEFFTSLVAIYRPLPYQGDILLFVTEETEKFQYVFWQRLVKGRFRVHQLDGGHESLLDKNSAKALAPALTQALQDEEALPSAARSEINPC